MELTLYHSQMVILTSQREEHATLLHDLAPFIWPNQEDLYRLLERASLLREPQGNNRDSLPVQPPPVVTFIPEASHVSAVATFAIIVVSKPQIAEITSRFERLEKAPAAKPDKHREALMKEMADSYSIGPGEKSRKANSYKTRSGKGERGIGNRKLDSRKPRLHYRSNE